MQKSKHKHKGYTYILYMTLFCLSLSGLQTR